LRLNQDLTEAHYNLGSLWLDQNKSDLARSELTAFTLRRGNSVEGFLKLGAALLASRDASAFSAAEKAFQEALRLEPQRAEALNGLGMVRYHQRRYSDAQQFFLAAFKQHPNFGPAILNLAILAQVRFQDYPGALQRYRQYLALKPTPPNADAVLAITKEIEERLKPPVTAPAGSAWSTSAAVSVQAAHSNGGLQVEAHTPAQTTPATSGPAKTSSPAASSSTNSRFTYKAPAKPTTGNRAEAERYFRQGRDAEDAHRLADAVTAYQAATQLDPTYFGAFYNLGLTATEAGNLQLALNAYASAVALVPDSADARYNFALLLKQAGYNTDAANELEKLIAKYPNDARAHLALANLSAQQLHDDARARQHYQKVLDADPHNAQANDIRRWIAEHPQ
jgi:tetratricopeptide (TPR) repeat protein